MHSLLVSKIKEELDSIEDISQGLLKVCELIHAEMEAYDWVGFYFMHHPSRKLHLGPYVGAPTDHTVIDFGKGIFKRTKHFPEFVSIDFIVLLC